MQLDPFRDSSGTEAKNSFVSRPVPNQGLKPIMIPDMCLNNFQHNLHDFWQSGCLRADWQAHLTGCTATFCNEPRLKVVLPSGARTFVVGLPLCPVEPSDKLQQISILNLFLVRFYQKLHDFWHVFEPISIQFAWFLTIWVAQGGVAVPHMDLTATRKTKSERQPFVSPLWRLHRMTPTPPPKKRVPLKMSAQCSFDNSELCKFSAQYSLSNAFLN